ncbi:MAG TPA: orotidine-5'-phosphate decarboxylase [Polyangiaceae bacterium]|nr:orotidine-5'-phosphate decarboxylase [Polyangiaceae bacterium]
MNTGAAPNPTPNPSERVIVALDVPSKDEALRIVDELDGVISFFKVGLELLMSGGMEDLLRKLVVGKKVFVDLKLPSDIPETVKRVVSLAADIGVTFLTLSNSATTGTIRAALEGRGDSASPHLLYVPFLSSLDRADFSELYGKRPEDFEGFLEQRTQEAKNAGADGFIVSGPEIRLLRNKYPDAKLVSPGIRPSGSPADDHKRACTPAQAMSLGADYIVVGRPIRNSSDRRAAAQRIVDEVANTLIGGSSASARPSAPGGYGGGNGAGYSSASSGSAPMLARSKD